MVRLEAGSVCTGGVMTKLKFHPVADLFPLMQGDEFDAHVADIREHGLREPIWLHKDGSIIDGRNRYRACVKIGIEPQTRTYTGPDTGLVAFVVSMNLQRRYHPAWGQTVAYMLLVGVLLIRPRGLLGR